MLFLASKTMADTEEGIRAELGESLARLQTDHVDLYYMHAPPDDVDEMNRHFDIGSTIVGATSVAQTGANLAVLALPSLPQALVDRLTEDYGRRTEEFNGG